MLKRNLLMIVAIGLGLVFSSSIIAQNGRTESAKRKANLGNRYDGLEEVHFTFGRKKPKANQRKVYLTYDLKNVMVSSRRKPQKPNSNQRKITRTKPPRGFTSTTQPFADGLRKKGSSTKRKSSQKRVTMQDGVLFPEYRSKSPRKPNSHN